MNQYSETFCERFWEKVDTSNPDGCWEWMGGKFRGNYGCFWNSKKGVLAHRFSYELYYGKIPKGILVCHKCDNPLCVRPDHLFLGEHIDNIVDAAEKGRLGRLHRKLTEEQVREIKRSTLPSSFFSKKFRVNWSVISRIRHNETYKEIK